MQQGNGKPYIFLLSASKSNCLVELSTPLFYFNFAKILHVSSLPWILGSKSPRRHQLMEMANIPFEIKTKDTEEIYPNDLLAEDIPVYLAELKARDIALDFHDRTILSADTIVLLQGKVLGKPQHREEAYNMLKTLSGQTHHVITGVCLLAPNSVQCFSDTTKVHFHTLSDQEINYYLDHYKPYDKAGAYAIQEWIGAVAIASIEGCFYNVMGLPISRVYALYAKK